MPIEAKHLPERDLVSARAGRGYDKLREIRVDALMLAMPEVMGCVMQTRYSLDFKGNHGRLSRIIHWAYDRGFVLQYGLSSCGEETHDKG